MTKFFVLDFEFYEYAVRLSFLCVLLAQQSSPRTKDTESILIHYRMYHELDLQDTQRQYYFESRLQKLKEPHSRSE